MQYVHKINIGGMNVQVYEIMEQTWQINSFIIEQAKVWKMNCKVRMAKVRLVYRTFVILFLFCNSVKSEQENLT